MAGAGLGQNQDPGTLPRSPVWLAEAQVLGLSSIAYPGTLVGSMIKSGAAGTQIGAHM